MYFFNRSRSPLSESKLPIETTVVYAYWNMGGMSLIKQHGGGGWGAACL